MRIGSNPTKDDNSLEQRFYHRIIIPVYIPELSGYFLEGLEILKLCLDSLFNTTHSKTAITVINNACCKEVTSYLFAEYEKGKIDQLIINKENKGKIDPLISIIRGVYEPLVTVTDADVLFMSNWQMEVEKVHKFYPNAGMVSPVPNSRLCTAFSASTWGYGLLNAKIRFSKVADPDGLIKFEKSITTESYFNQYQLEQILTIEKNGFLVCLGCGHFVATFKRDVFNYAPKVPSLKKIVGGSENKYIDEPNDKAGFLRLATYSNYAYHMGNKSEPWMYEKLPQANINQTTVYHGSDFIPKFSIFAKLMNALMANDFGYKYKSKIFRKIHKSRIFRKNYAASIGLEKSASIKYFINNA